MAKVGRIYCPHCDVFIFNRWSCCGIPWTQRSAESLNFVSDTKLTCKKCNNRVYEGVYCKFTHSISENEMHAKCRRCRVDIPIPFVKLPSAILSKRGRNIFELECATHENKRRRINNRPHQPDDSGCIKISLGGSQEIATNQSVNQGEIRIIQNVLRASILKTLWSFIDYRSSDCHIEWQQCYSYSGKAKRTPFARLVHISQQDCSSLFRFPESMTIPIIKMPAFLVSITRIASSLCGEEFNGIIMNYYADGTDHYEWHRPSHNIVGDTMAVLSLGAERTVEFLHDSCERQDWKSNMERYSLEQDRLLYQFVSHNGDFMILNKSVLNGWQQRVPIVRRCHEPHISLTFCVL